MKTPLKKVARLLVAIFLLLGAFDLHAQVYSYAFGNECGNGCTFPSPWTGTPDILATGLSNSSWATNYADGFIDYDGSCGNSSCNSLAIAGNNEPASTTYTLSFTVLSGYSLDITGISFWSRASSTGPKYCAISINGTSAFNTVTLSTTGFNTGTLTPITSFNNLTGTVNLVLTLTGATGSSGTFRLDNFVIDGSVTSGGTPPTVYNVTGGGTACSYGNGETVGLSGSQTGVNYQLYDNGVSVGSPMAGNGSAITFGTYNVTGTYTVIATNTTSLDTSVMSGSAVITIDPAPTASVTTADSIICSGHSATLRASGGTGYAWSVGGTADSTVITTPSTGSYSVTVTGAGNCTASASINLTVLPPVTNSVSKTICSGQSYDGHNTTGIFVDTLTSSSGCDSIVTLTLMVQSTITTAVSKSICNGQSYDGHNSTGVFVDTLISSGGCDSVVTLTLTVQSVLTTSVTQVSCNGLPYNGHATSGTYVDTLQSSGGCDSVVTLNLTVVPTIPVQNISQTICSGQSYDGHNTAGVFTDTLISSTGCDSVIVLTLTVLNSSGVSINQTICAGDTFMGYTASGSYVDTFQNVNGCDSIVYLQLTVSTPPSVTLSLSFDTICADADTIVLTGGSPAGGVYSGTAVTNGVFNPYYAPYGQDTIYYTYGASGCNNTATAYAFELHDPYVTLQLPFDTICGNANTMVLTGGSPAGGTYSGAGVSSGVFNPYYAPYGQDTIYYTYTNASGCSRTWHAYAYELTPPYVNLQLPGDTFCNGSGPVTLSGGSPVGGTYSGTYVSSGQFDPGAAIIGQDTVYYSYTDSNGCTGNWHEYVQVEVCAGIQFENTASFNVYPIPTSDELMVEATGDNSSGRILLYDVMGRIVIENPLSSTETALNLKNMPAGVYMLVITDDTAPVYSRKVIKE